MSAVNRELENSGLLEEGAVIEYRRAGYDNRRQYIEGLSEAHGVDLDSALIVADLLGPDEDFDGLVTTLEDVSQSGSL